MSWMHPCEGLKGMWHSACVEYKTVLWKQFSRWGVRPLSLSLEGGLCASWIVLHTRANKDVDVDDSWQNRHFNVVLHDSRDALHIDQYFPIQRTAPGLCAAHQYENVLVVRLNRQICRKNMKHLVSTLCPIVIDLTLTDCKLYRVPCWILMSFFSCSVTAARLFFTAGDTMLSPTQQHSHGFAVSPKIVTRAPYLPQLPFIENNLILEAYL